MERNARFGFALGSLGDIDDNKLEGILLLISFYYVLTYHK